MYSICVAKEMLYISGIIEKCGIGTLPVKDVLENISLLEDIYGYDDIIEIYNYILQNSKDIELLSGIMRLLSNYRDKSTLPLLINILLLKSLDLEESDALINLRVLCSKVIASYKDTSTVGALLYCLNNKNENYKIRLACADALGRIGDRYAVEPLINVVKDEEEKSVYVKESAAFALGLIGDVSAVDPLVAIMEAKQGIIDKFTFLKEKVIEALGRINCNNDKVLKVYKSSLSDASPVVRINTIEALMNSDYEEATDLIRIGLHDEDEEVQRNALIALYNIIGRDVLDEVISLPGYSKFLKEEAKNIIDEYEE